MSHSTSEDKGYYFRYSKHLNQSGLSENELNRRSGVNRSLLNKIKAAKEPVSKEKIYAVITTLNDILYSRSENNTKPIAFSDEYMDQEELRQARSDGFPATTKRTFEQREPATGPLIEGINPIEFAVIALTNPKDWANSTSEEPFRILTTNDVYYFVPYILSILNFDGEESEEAFGDNLEFLASTLQNRYGRQFEKQILALEDSFEIGAKEKDMLEILGVHDGARAIQDTNRLLRSLCDRGLIEDPLVETVGLVGVSVLGLVPMSFTKRTEEGDIVYRKISALLWDYEYLAEDEKVETKLHFNAKLVIDTIKNTVFKLNELLSEKTN